jgi:vacuolar protein sorting-associated protein 1
MLGDTSTWSCQISVRYDYDRKGIRLPMSQVIQFGPKMSDKSDVELWMRRAQAAILSPHQDYRLFYHKNKEELRNLRNVDPKVLTIPIILYGHF